MKVVLLDVYQAVPVYEMFEDCFYTHIDDIVYFFVPDHLYAKHSTALPKHIANDYPLNFKNLSHEIINNT